LASSMCAPQVIPTVVRTSTDSDAGMTETDSTEPLERGLLVSAVGAAVAASVLLVWVTSSYSAPSLSCVAGPVPYLTRLAVTIAYWTWRLLPMFFFLAGPLTLFGVAVAVLPGQGVSRRRAGRLVAALVLSMAALEVAASGVVVYAAHAADRVVRNAHTPCG
jgi:hypothetical protein